MACYYDAIFTSGQRVTCLPGGRDVRAVRHANGKRLHVVGRALLPQQFGRQGGRQTRVEAA